MSTPATMEAVPTAEALPWVTTEEMLALPGGDQVERWLLWGKLIKRPMTRRGFSTLVPRHKSLIC